MKSHGISRRYFFYGSLLAGAVPVAGYGSVPSLRALGYKPYYNKLNVAAIGCGGQGGAILNQAAQTENIVALCDVDLQRPSATLKNYEKLPLYRDFRVMLDKEGKNIDACTIGIPDFMHAVVALACMQQGKHVYVEKPLTRTPWEARLLLQAAEKYKVATQMGNQGFSHECHRVAAEIVWSGEIGDVTEAHISTTPGTHPTALQQPPPEESVPPTLNWDAWLGAMPMRPYSSWYVPYNWRGFFDFGTGQIGNWATHTAGPVHHALQLEAPTSLECENIDGRSNITFPDRATIRLDFPARGGMPPVKVFYHDSARATGEAAYRVPGMEDETILPPTDNLADKGRPTRVGQGGFPGQGPGGRRPAQQQRPAGERVGPGGPGVRVFGDGIRGGATPGVLTGNGSVFIGTKGIMATSNRGEGVWLLPSARWQEYRLPPQLLTRSPGHMLDWIRACKGGDASCSDFRVAVPFAEWLALAAIAFRVPGKLNWDSKAMRFTNSDEANKYVKPVFRPGWELKV
ncbi:MAG: Gfo/Idh/MocA family oxidoreductase [Bryobacteraceae bacterium]|nr:Gfo/Idh/MocA family oxidoreductase [Solibacteraceae bacterium]MCO5353074.1 Gfo/Idh/MocA family oxidoreductase [Bryobacteraceae bacterium]